MKVPFNKLYISGNEFNYMHQAVDSDHLHGDGKLTAACHEKLRELTGANLALLTTSGTASLDMAALLCNLSEKDEVIIPSYTFVSTANAFALRGAKIAWCDVREDTLNIDETKIEALINENTKAIGPVHYAGVSCEMDTILKIAKKYSLKVIEDAAQGMCAYYKGRALGSMGDLGALSFHGSKNITCGEGGAILVNDKSLEFRAYVVREKGTNRTEFMQGKADKYTWVDYGSSFLPSELSAAYLLAQLENAREITKLRVDAWNYYYESLKPLSDASLIKLATIPEGCVHNAHIFYLLANSESDAKKIFAHLKEKGVAATSHYAPLHNSPMGKKLSKPSVLEVSESVAKRIVRLPIFSSITREQQDWVCDSIREIF